MVKEDHNMWKSDKDEFELHTLPWLQDNGIFIGVQSQDGNEQAIAIVHYYKMLYRSYDPMTHQLLKEAIKAYVEAYKAQGVTL